MDGLLMSSPGPLRLWTSHDRSALQEAVKQGRSLEEIATSLNRSTTAVAAQAYKLGLAILL